MQNVLVHFFSDRTIQNFCQNIFLLIFQEHRGQVILYSMMMSERRPDPGNFKKATKIILKKFYAA